MSYSVKYKLRNQWFWRRIVSVKGDLVASDVGKDPIRVFIQEDETRIEIPIEGTQFIFSKNRFLVVKKNMENESNQKINLK